MVYWLALIAQIGLYSYEVVPADKAGPGLGPLPKSIAITGGQHSITKL
jgi:hypothetical protein